MKKQKEKFMSVPLGVFTKKGEKGKKKVRVSFRLHSKNLLPW